MLSSLGAKRLMGAKRLGGKRLGGKRLGGETTRGGNGLGANRPGFLSMPKRSVTQIVATMANIEKVKILVVGDSG